MKTKTIALLLAGLLTLMLAACSPAPSGSAPASSQPPTTNSHAPDPSPTESAPELSTDLTPVSIMGTGWLNIPPVNPEDPFQQYLRDNYYMEATLLSYSDADFPQKLALSMASEDKPDIISAGSKGVNSINEYYVQGTLIDDWTPWLKYMPNVKAYMESKPLELKQITEDGKIKMLFFNPDINNWSVKVRRDWLDEYCAEKGLPANTDLATSDEVLDFARWVKSAKNDPNSIDTYAFSSAGTGVTIGSIEWTQQMFGHSVNGMLAASPTAGFYIKSDGTISHPIIDGTYHKWLEFMRTLVSEQLIHPDWFTQEWAMKGTGITEGKVAFDLYPGVIVEETYNAARNAGTYDEGRETLSWWDNMDMPCDPGNQYKGMPVGTQFGHIFSVSYQTSLDEQKMLKICALLNDLVVQYDPASNQFIRPAAYEALRWAVGIVPNVEIVPLEGTASGLCNVEPEMPEGVVNYRVENVSAWDWGAWFSCTADGVIEAKSLTADTMSFVKKNSQLSTEASTMDMYFTPGSLFIYDPVIVSKMFDEYVQYTYQYATGVNSISIDQFVEKWRTELHGDEMLVDAERQFVELGLK